MTLATFTPPAALTPGLYPQTTGQFFSPDQTLINGSAPGSANNPNINLQITIEEQHTDEMEIVDHPIEVGAPITDHTFKRPAELTLHLGWTAAQIQNVTGGTQEQYLNALAQVYSQLLQGQANRVLYNVNTTKRVYQDMMIKSISTITDKDNRNVLMVTVVMRQLLTVGPQLLSVSAPIQQQLMPKQTNPPAALGFRGISAATNYKPSTP